jgi:hypothetical protein
MVMNWIPVENSQAMSHYGYDPASQTFAIRTTGGTPYFYLDVPADVHAQFTQAPSKGKFWIAQIKTRYQCQKGDGTLAQQSPVAAPVHPKVEKIVEQAAEQASSPLILSTAALEQSVVKPIGEMIADLRGQMSAHCAPVMEEIADITDQALQIWVRDEQSYTTAAELGRKLADKRKGVTAMMQPTKRAIDQVKQVVLDKEKELLTLAEQGESRLKKLCTDYRTEQQRIKNAEAETERRRLLKEAEDKRIAQAEQAQEAGRTVLADKLLSTPVTAPEVKPQAAVPKGVTTARMNYRWRLTPGYDITKIPPIWLQLDVVAIGKHARENKLPDGTVLHGIEFYQEPDTSF